MCAWLQDVGCYQPSTVSRRLSVVVGFCRVCVVDQILPHSPADYVRRPTVPAESPTGPVWTDSAYTGTLLDLAAAFGITVQIVAKLASQVGFHVLPRRWVVERTLAWITRCRRNVRDYERRPAHHAAN